MMRLNIANKCYSSWSLRPWLLMKTLGVPFEERLIPLAQPETADAVGALSPSGLLPVLEDDGVVVWESLAIMDHLADSGWDGVWPEDRAARAMARSVAAEMHAGFPHLRREYPFNLGKRFAYRDRPAADQELARVHRIVTEARERFGSGGAFLFGAFSAADAMYAPVMSRLETFSVPVEGVVAEYKDAVLSLPAFVEWRRAALKETWTIASDEIDEEPIEDLRGPVVPSG